MRGSTLADYGRWRADTPEMRLPRGCDALCHAPFVSVLLDPRGDVHACCQSVAHALGNVAEEPLSAIWRGARIQAFRSSLEHHELPGGCESCAFEIGCGNFPQVFARMFDALPVPSARPEWPLSIWFALSNACNLECLQCSGELSSAIRKNRDRLPPLPRAYGDAFFEDLRSILPHLRHAAFLGGEAFLSRENFRIWDMMIGAGLRFPITIVTNGTVFDARVERVLEHLPAGISISLDGASAETVESIRRNARFDTVMANVEAFRRHTSARGQELALSFCLMPQNQHELADFLLLAEARDCSAAINVVYEPEAFSLRALGAEQLGAVLAGWERRDPEMRRSLRRHLDVWSRELERVRRWQRAAAERNP